MHKIPVLFTRKADCCGCAVCYAVCPKGAICMIEDTEGFEYPEINSDSCIGCDSCIKACPIQSNCDR